MSRNVTSGQNGSCARFDTQVARVIANHRLRIDDREFAICGKAEGFNAAILEILVGEVRAASGAIVRCVSGISARRNRTLSQMTFAIVFVSTGGLLKQSAFCGCNTILDATWNILTSSKLSEPSSVLMAAT